MSNILSRYLRNYILINQILINILHKIPLFNRSHAEHLLVRLLTSERNILFSILSMMTIFTKNNAAIGICTLLIILEVNKIR